MEQEVEEVAATAGGGLAIELNINSTFYSTFNHQFLLILTRQLEPLVLEM
jgi:hypothetical protein